MRSSPSFDRGGGARSPAGTSCRGLAKVPERLLARARRWAAAGLVGLLVGCATGTPGGRGSADITELHVFTFPAAVRAGSTTEPDGIALKVFACKADDSKGVPITGGSLEVLLFDGPLLVVDPAKLTPRKTWVLTAAELKRYEFKKSLGVGYDLALSWREAKPTASKLTVLARLLPPRGAPIYSDPTVITLRSR